MAARGESYLPHQIVAEARADSISVRQHLLDIANATRQQVFEQASNLSQPPQTDAEVLEAAQHFERDGEALTNYIEEQNLDLAPVLATRDPDRSGEL